MRGSIWVSPGFRHDHTENGRPAYHPKNLLKLYLYGHMNRMRSFRELEKDTSATSKSCGCSEA
ncbi:MAG: transposase [Bacteroidetes bacterium]|nr:transposase [Bacteroidota bacterium]